MKIVGAAGLGGL